MAAMAYNHPEGSDPRGRYGNPRGGQPDRRGQYAQPPPQYRPLPGQYEQPPAQHGQQRGQYEVPRAPYPEAAQRYPEQHAPYDEPPRAPYDEPRARYEQRPSPPESARGDAQAYPERRRSGAENAAVVANIINVVVGLIATIFVLHIVFVVAGANHSNSVVSFVYQVSRAFVLGFGDVFTPNDAKIGVVLNYGLAALVYLVVGHLIVRALRRR